MGGVGEDRRKPPNRRLTVDQAADALGVTAEAVRGRIRRDTIDHERVSGRVYVLLPDEQQTEQTTDHTAELIRTLQEQLAAERQAHAEARRIIAGLVERIPAIEAPPEASGSPETVEEEPERADPRSDAPGDQEGVERQSWWRRVFGG
jgi:hypothetical protein